jgi:hypothetical protein
LGKYRVILAIDVDGKRYEYGDVIELEMQVALDFAHALQLIEEE